MPIWNDTDIMALRAIIADRTAERDTALAKLERVREEKDGAYHERNMVVAALAKCFPSCRTRTAIEGWDEEWHGCVFIELPTGQASWHYHDSQAAMFAFLPERKVEWDGHTTEEKYARLANLRAEEPTDGERSLPQRRKGVRMTRWPMTPLGTGLMIFSMTLAYLAVGVVR